MQLTLEAARSMRDGAIDATAALNEALREALATLPASEHGPVQHAVGRAMASIFDEVLHPAIQAFPELEPAKEAWIAIAKSQARKRASA